MGNVITALEDQFIESYQFVDVIDSGLLQFSNCKLKSLPNVWPDEIDLSKRYDVEFDIASSSVFVIDHNETTDWVRTYQFYVTAQLSCIGVKDTKINNLG